MRQEPAPWKVGGVNLKPTGVATVGCSGPRPGSEHRTLQFWWQLFWTRRPLWASFSRGQERSRGTRPGCPTREVALEVAIVRVGLFRPRGLCGVRWVGFCQTTGCLEGAMSTGTSLGCLQGNRLPAWTGREGGPGSGFVGDPEDMPDGHDPASALTVTRGAELPVTGGVQQRPAGCPMKTTACRVKVRIF